MSANTISLFLRVQYHFTGPGATAFLEKITPADLQALPPHQSTLSALLHPKTGGIVDDTIITRLDKDEFYVVTNAGCREKDAAFFTANLDAWNNANQPRVDKIELKNQGLVALQGPLSAEILQGVLAPSSDNIDLNAPTPLSSSDPTGGRRRQQRSSSRQRGPPSDGAGANSDIEGFPDDEVVGARGTVRRSAGPRQDIPRVVDVTGETLSQRFEEFLEG